MICAQQRLVLAALLGLIVPRVAAAHRLDEYLQATRISVERSKVLVEINLTPGAEVADKVLARIDRDLDGEVSADEAGAYARSFVEQLRLSTDGIPRRLTLDAFYSPSAEQMRQGEGVLRLRISTSLSETATGKHHLVFENAHRSEFSVYLVNALIPKDDRIHITGQSRDMLQREFTLDYTVSAESEGSWRSSAALPPLLGLGLAGMLGLAARRLNAVRP